MCNPAVNADREMRMQGPEEKQREPWHQKKKGTHGVPFLDLGA